jgi:hypothetical protein
MKRNLFLAAATLLLAACADEPTAPGQVALEAARYSAAGHVLHVPRDYPTIQAAVDAAGEGDIVQVHRGTYTERVVITKSEVRLHASAGAVLDGSTLGGIGIHVLGTASAPVTDVEISGFEVANFERGIVLQWARGARVHRSDVHHNLDRTPPLALGDATGIDLVTTHDSEVTQNRVHHNGDTAVGLRVGSTGNLVRGNSIHENGIQRRTNLDGRGVLITGAGTNDNQILNNEIVGNYGRGIVLARPAGTSPITGTRIAQNRLHENYRSGIALMDAVTGNLVEQNDARRNNLSGLAPCYQCNLVDLSIGGNTWERNLGTFNLTDACAP